MVILTSEDSKIVALKYKYFRKESVWSDDCLGLRELIDENLKLKFLHK